MILKRIRLVNYKNYQDQLVEVDSSINTIVGQNGMGKTNLLDAIYYLSLGKSYFSSSDKLVCKKEESFFQLEAIIDINGQDSKLVIKVAPSRQKSIEIDGSKQTKMIDYVGTFPTVVIAPTDIQKMISGSIDRRMFLNNTLSQIDKTYLGHLLVYNKLLKQRAALLKSFLENKNYDQLLLETIDDRMELPAAYITEARSNLVKKLSVIFEDYYSSISDGNETCSFEYKSSLAGLSFKDASLKFRDADRFLGRTKIGIHKDDLIFKMNGDSLKDYASQGQLKSFVLALKLSQYQFLSQQKNVLPFLLLDDIFDKLDGSRIKHLLELLGQNRVGQVFITDPHEERVPLLLKSNDIDHRVINISNGTIVS